MSRKKQRDALHHAKIITPKQMARMKRGVQESSFGDYERMGSENDYRNMLARKENERRREERELAKLIDDF